MYSYTIIRKNSVDEESVIFQTNSYAEAEKILNYFNENKCKYGYAKDNYKILQNSNTKKINDTIKNILK